MSIKTRTLHTRIVMVLIGQVIHDRFLVEMSSGHSFDFGPAFSRRALSPERLLNGPRKRRSSFTSNYFFRLGASAHEKETSF